MTRHPNLLLIVADQLKATALRLYGGSVVKTPALDHLAGRSVLFEQAFTPYPLCVPARCAMFAGQYPHSLGVRDNSGRLPSQAPHLLRLLDEAGYRLGLSGKNHCFGQTDLARFDMRFEVGHHGPPQGSEQLRHFLSHSRFSAPCGAATNPLPASHCASSLITDRAIDFVNADRGPWFLWLSYPDPHPPFQAPRPFSDFYDPDSLPTPETFEESLENKPVRQRIARRMFGMDAATSDQLRPVIAMYYAMISYLDSELARLIDVLERAGRLEDTVVVFTSDHGEYLGEHGLIRKSNAFYDCLVHVPLLLSVPGVKPVRNGSLVELTDLAPTLVDLLGLAEEPTGRVLRRAADGQSLSGVLGSCGDTDRRLALAEAGTEGQPSAWGQLADVPEGPLDGGTPPWGARPDAWRGRGVMMRTEEWKYVHYLGSEIDELYDLRSDPNEAYNLLHQPAFAAQSDALAGDLAECLLLTRRRWPLAEGSSSPVLAAADEIREVRAKVADRVDRRCGSVRRLVDRQRTASGPRRQPVQAQRTRVRKED